MDTEAIRLRIKSQGWSLLERPISGTDPNTRLRIIRSWRLVAAKGDKTVEITGKDIDEAMKNIGRMLGVIPRS